MKRSALITLILFGIPVPAGAAVDFLRDFQPLFEARCYECHGAEKSKADLRLDSRERAMRGGESGPVIVPGKAASSRLIERVSSADPDEVMPPKASG